jgi:aminopeptidase
MVDSRIEKLAKLCVHYCVAVKPKENVVIQGSELAFPLINEIFRECLLSDAYPYVKAELDVAYTYYRHAREHQLKFVSPFEKFMDENMDVQIRIECQPNPKRLTNIDPSKIQLRRASGRESSEILRKRSLEGKFRSVILPYPINAQAQEAAVSLEEYEDFVYKSCLVDSDDPITEWNKIHEQQERICRFLNQTDEIHVLGKDTDLTFSVKGRKWINCSGKENMPDGEVFTSPIEDSANGTVRFTLPGIFSEKEVEDIRLTFTEGKVVEASAAKGNELLQRILGIDGADRIGETAIGTNYGITKFTKNMLFDEKIGGTIHLALGMSFPESGGLNESAVHWDILKDMKKNGEIYADGKLFYKNGKFVM